MEDLTETLISLLNADVYLEVQGRGIPLGPPKSISNLVLVSQQVNNATARVMTNKKAANPYTNGNGTRKGGEVSSEPGIPGKGAGLFSSKPPYRLGMGRCF